MNEVAKLDLRQLWEDKPIIKGTFYEWPGQYCLSCNTLPAICTHRRYPSLNKHLINLAKGQPEFDVKIFTGTVNNYYVL